MQEQNNSKASHYILLVYKIKMVQSWLSGFQNAVCRKRYKKYKYNIQPSQFVFSIQEDQDNNILKYLSKFSPKKYKRTTVSLRQQHYLIEGAGKGFPKDRVQSRLWRNLVTHIADNATAQSQRNWHILRRKTSQL